ncbi:DUF1062 domain-containing protein [Micromonospora sp. NPDC006766]|uniref:DUF1062 domain-containing protein n=1 Tax=Micromonospora sp. NPDC006766 TaxID=3154778 RepID=UPI0034058CB3
MSTRPHVVLPWTVGRTRLSLLAIGCAHCYFGLASAGDGKFRVIANGELLDIWPLVACIACDRTSKITVQDRVPVRRLDPIPLKGGFGNPSHRGPEPRREARWPCAGLHRAAVRARSLMTRERRSRSARYRRQR